MIAHTMGCSEIILVGVDGCRKFGRRYFWQLQQYISECQESLVMPFRNDGISVDRYEKCKLKGQITDVDLVDIGRTWDVLGTAINQKCKVYNASETSIVTIFPKKKFETIIEELDGS